MDEGFTLRGLFIISDKGVVRHITHNDPPVGRNVDEVLRLVRAYQFTDEHGEVCPANWQPGKPTVNILIYLFQIMHYTNLNSQMKPDPKGSLSYFEQVNA